MQAVGGFDKRFFLYWEDTDLCRRMWDAGWKVIYYPRAKVIHSVGKSSSTRPIFANYQFHKSCYRLYDKYAQWPFSVLTPVAGIALMLRFLLAALYNYLNIGSILNRSDLRQKELEPSKPKSINLGNQQIKKVPTVSIITVAKNCESTIEATINSINQQSYPSIEHIIIDGVSTDNTLNILTKQREKYSLLVSEPDKGIYDAMNKGLNLASGDIIGFLNADDIFADAEIINDVVNRIVGTGKDAVFGDLVYVRPSKPKRIVRYYDSSGFTRKWLAIGAMPAHPTLYLRRSIYERFGEYKTDYRIAADFEFIARIFGEDQTSYSYLPKVMVRMSTGGISTKNLKSNWVLNREMIRACSENNIPTNIFRILLKYPKKIAGIVKARRMPLMPS